MQFGLDRALARFRGRGKRAMQRVLKRPAAYLYRQAPARASAQMLSVLGVAEQIHRQDFVTLARIIESIPKFEGSVIECGVYRGMTLLGMAHLLRLRGHRVPIYGYDSFAGFPQPTEQDARPDGSFHEHAQQGHYRTTSEQELAATIRRLGFDDQVRLVKGYFEDTLPKLNASERFTLIHVDCDLYAPYVTCLELLYPRLLPGGYMVFDDYQGETVYPGAKRAVDAFFRDRPEKPETFDVPYPRWFVRKR